MVITRDKQNKHHNIIEYIARSSNGHKTFMLKTIYSSPVKLRMHLDAPLLNERQRYLEERCKSVGLRQKQHLADIILSSISALGLNDNDTSAIPIEELTTKISSWSDKTIHSNLSEIARWLRFIGRLDPIVDSDSLIFNKFCVKVGDRINYITTPYYEERLSHLEFKEKNGAKFSSLRCDAQNQIRLVNLGLDPTKKQTLEDLRGLVASIESEKSKTNLIGTGISWLRHLGNLMKSECECPFKEHLESYLSWCTSAKGLCEDTVALRKGELTRFLSFLNDEGVGIRGISLGTVDSYIELRKSQGCGRRTLSGLLTHIRGFISYLAGEGIISDISGQVHGPIIFKGETLPIAPTWEQVKQLLSYYGTDTPTGIRNTLIILLIAVYGLRTSEVCNIKPSDIKWETEELWIRRVKNPKPKVLPLTDEIKDLLLDYLLNVRNNDIDRKSLFLTMPAPYRGINSSTVYALVSRAYKGLGIELNHIGGHSLRYACASNIVNSGGTFKDVADLLGHRSMRMAMKYGKVDLNSLRKVSDMDWEGLL